MHKECLWSDLGNWVGANACCLLGHRNQVPQWLSGELVKGAQGRQAYKQLTWMLATHENKDPRQCWHSTINMQIWLVSRYHQCQTYFFYSFIHLHKDNETFILTHLYIFLNTVKWKAAMERCWLFKAVYPIINDNLCFALCDCNWKIGRCIFTTHALTTNSSMLFQVLPPHSDILHQALSSMSSSLLHRVFGTKCTDGHILKWKS